MNENTAHDAANMIKAQVNLGRNPNSIQPKWLESMINNEEVSNRHIEHSATSEEYDVALEKIENLKKLAEEEPATAKVLYSVGRIFRITSDIFLGDLLKGIEQSIKGEESKEGTVINFNKKLIEKLDDASAQLQRAKEAGERYRKAELTN